MARIEHHPILDIPHGRKEVSFSFDGRPMPGYEHEPVSSALVAAGISTFSRHHKDGMPQGLFCANGQCSQCIALVDGFARKLCVTPLREGMDVRTLEGLPVLPPSERKAGHMERRLLSTDVLVVGGGPSGLAAAAELGRLGLNVVVADDKSAFGGKLVLQTHKFFGSEADCYAGTRGMAIAHRLETELALMPSVTMLKNAPVVGVFKDRKAGIVQNDASYLLVGFTALVVATGAREKSLLFPGNDLPGVYGAGAFQTLVNRDLVRAAGRVLVIGSGNVGLIAAYHALQAGIQVAGIVEILGKVNGYKVHADKILRAGVPIYLHTTVLSVEGDGRAERATVAEVDSLSRPVPGTERVYKVDTVLVAAGLVPCDELHKTACEYGFLSVCAGDAEEIAEASSALFGGRIAAFSLARMLGVDVDLDPSWIRKRDVLKSRPGEIVPRKPETLSDQWKRVFFCSEEIPCNPCTSVCPTSSIRLRTRKGTILDLPQYVGNECKGCALCVAACPGLAVSLVRRIDDSRAEVMIPCEFDGLPGPGSMMDLLDQDGKFLENATLVKKAFNRPYRTWLLTFRTSHTNATLAIGVGVQKATATEPEDTMPAVPGDCDPVVCRCERIRAGSLVDFIRENRVRDANQLKIMRLGMGSCGAKTCGPILPQLFRRAGVDPGEVADLTLRPLTMEVPMSVVANEGRETALLRDASQRGAP